MCGSIHDLIIRTRGLPYRGSLGKRIKGDFPLQLTIIKSVCWSTRLVNNHHKRLYVLNSASFTYTYYTTCPFQLTHFATSTSHEISILKPQHHKRLYDTDQN
ncbi:hypothetical protein R6Q59_036075 [Mikania micrantha]